jgi:hypothetical protein
VWSISAHPDRVGGLVLAAVGGFLAHHATHLPFGSLRAPDAGFFPITLTVMLCIAGLWIFARSFRVEAVSLDFTSRSWAVVGATAALFLYGAFLDRVGFLVSTTLMLLLLMRVFGGMGWGKSVLITVPMVAVTYLGFIELGVPLPRGIFGFA